MSFSLNALTAVVSDKKEKQKQRAERELKVDERERERWMGMFWRRVVGMLGGFYRKRRKKYGWEEERVVCKFNHD